MSESAIKWLLFCLMAATLPVIYFMFVIGGFLPLIAIAAISFSGAWGSMLFNVLHLVIYSLLFYWAARFIARRISMLAPQWRIAGLAVISIALAAISFLPIYGVGHHEYRPVNLYRLYHTYLYPRSDPPRAIRP